MNRRVVTSVLLVLLSSGVFGCSIYPTSVERMRDNEVVVDAWAMGKRGEKRKEYERAKEEYYFVKRFATTYYLKVRAQQRYERVSGILEEAGEKD